MHIIFGCELNTGSFPDALGNRTAEAGTVVLGPAGLVGLLETRLGLTGLETHHSVRIGQYLCGLREADNDKCFYSQSLAVDAWSTAGQLLYWRDELISGGWQGKIPTASSKRLKDLAAVEKLLNNGLSPGIGERLRAVLEFLETKPNLDIKIIELIEARDSLPYIWQEVLTKLENCNLTIETRKAPQPQGASDLALLQKGVFAKKSVQKKISGDQSLCLIKAASEWEAAEALASWLGAQKNDLSNIVIIHEGGSRILDSRLHEHNLPSLGTMARSRWRAAMQVLPLIISNYWEPLDPHILLEILTLPKSPIQKRYARCFEKALREHPGVGGALWQEAWDEATSIYCDSSNDKVKRKPTDKELKDFHKNLQFWLGEKRCKPGDGMPVSVIKDICTRVSQWAGSRGGFENDDLLMSSADLADAVGTAAEASGLDKFTRPQLERLLDSVMDIGLSHPETCREAAPWSVISSPGQIWHNADTIIWWNFTNQGTFSRYSPWTKEEMSVIHSLGVKLDGPMQGRFRSAEYWHNPIRHANRRLILVTPETQQGEALGLHPLWDEIRYLLNLDPSTEQKLLFDASAIWQQNKPELPDCVLKQKKVPSLSPPEPQLVWKIADPALCSREVESATSVQRLIECPLSWVFRYVLRLETGSLISLPGGSLLMGNLSHKIIETLFSSSKKLSPAKARKESVKLFDAYVPRMAAVLLLPGRELERRRYRNAIGNAIENLVTIFNQAGLTVAEVETKKEKKLLKKQKFSGRIDMLLEDEEKKNIFVDFKWSSNAKYKREELQEGKALQLAAYSWLLRDGNKRFPPGGYYLLAQSEIIFSRCDILPQQFVFNDIELETTWNQALNAYRKRMDELSSGQAQAAGLLPEDDKTSAIPADILALAPQCKWCDYVNLCGSEGA